MVKKDTSKSYKKTSTKLVFIVKGLPGGVAGVTWELGGLGAGLDNPTPCTALFCNGASCNMIKNH